jgi:hypothetical protein
MFTANFTLPEEEVQSLVENLLSSRARVQEWAANTISWLTKDNGTYTRTLLTQCPDKRWSSDPGHILTPMGLRNSGQPKVDGTPWLSETAGAAPQVAGH